MVLRPALRLPVPLSRRALNLLRHLSHCPRDVQIEPRTFGEVEGEAHTPGSADGAIGIVYFHGGGYRVGSTATQRGLVAHIARSTGAATASVEYRLAPEHPCPAAIDDGLAAYEAVASEPGRRVVLSGDSAGAGVALAVAIAARDRGLPQPAGLALISPWVDLAMTGASYARNAKAEAVLTVSLLRDAARDYCGGRDLDDPLCSPLYADLAGLPPMTIHTGSHDLLQSDCEALAERVRISGGEAELRVFEDLWHDFHLHAGHLADADLAVAELGAWIAARLRAPV